MKKSKSLFISVLLIACILFSGCNDKDDPPVQSDLLDVRSNGTAIQWKYNKDSEWRDLVTLDELRGATGEEGSDGQNGKAVEIRRTESCVQWRYEDGEWQNLVALSDIEGPAGQKGDDGTTGKTPEFRVKENTLQWRYTGDEIWLNLYDLSSLKGLDGKNGDKGDPGEKGDPGDKGDRGDPGEKGENGVCTGWFYGIGSSPRVFLQNEKAYPRFREKLSSGGLVSCNENRITLKKGHTYSVNITGSIWVGSNRNDFQLCVVMTDGYDDSLTRDLTRIQLFGGAKDGQNIQQSFSFNRIYNAKDAEVVLKFAFEQEEYDTVLHSFDSMITVIALD